MNYLITDTTGESLSVILVNDDKEYTYYRANNLRHNAEVMSAIDNLMLESGLKINDIDYFSAVTGPGSFTGIRIGVTIMNAFKDVTNKKLIDINTFEMIGHGHKDIIALIDARNNNYYGAEFTNGKIIRMGDYRQADLDLNFKQKLYRKNIDYSVALIEIVRDKALRGETVERLKPLYLKNSQAERELVKKNYETNEMNSIHLSDVMEIEREIFSNPWIEDMYRETIDNKDAYSYVIESNGEIIGYYSILQMYDEMHIMKIGIRNNMRRQGYGDILLSHIIEITKITTAKLITLEVRVSNIAAQTLYTKYGFKCIGVRKKYYEMKEDALIYTLELGR